LAVGDWWIDWYFRGGAASGHKTAFTNESGSVTVDQHEGSIFANGNNSKFDVVSKFRIAQGSGPYWAHMHIDNGILYLRHGEYFAAYKIK
jgi:hypothetical protein